MSPASATRRIAILALIGGLGGGLAFPILPALGLELGIPGFMVGLILAANRISRLIFNVPAGNVIGRLGPRRTLSGALFVETVGILCYSAALHFGNATWWFLVGRVIFGIGTAFLLVGAQAAVLSLSAKEDRGRKVSTVRVAVSAAMPCGLVLGGVLADVFSEDVAFLTGAAMTLAGALFAVVFLPSALARSSDPETGSARRSGFTSLLASPNLAFLVAAWGFNLFIFLSMQGVLLATMVLLVQQREIHMFGLQAQGASGVIMAVLIGCSALVAFGLGRAIDRVSLRFTLVIPSLVGLAAGFAVLGMAQSLWPTLLGAALVGIFINGVTLPLLVLLGDSVSDRQYGPAVGIYQLFGDIGGTIGPILGIEVGLNIGLTPLYVTIAALSMLAILVAVWLRGRERRLNAPPA